MTESHRSIALVIGNPTPDIEAALYGLMLEAGDTGCSVAWAEKEATHEHQEAVHSLRD
mgnify:CR=1 FL=1